MTSTVLVEHLWIPTAALLVRVPAGPPVARVLLAVVAVARHPADVFSVAVAVAAGIELFQLAVPALGRSCTTTDRLANALGAILGTVLSLLARRLASRLVDRLPPPARASDRTAERALDSGRCPTSAAHLARCTRRPGLAQRLLDGMIEMRRG